MHLDNPESGCQGEEDVIVGFNDRVTASSWDVSLVSCNMYHFS